MKKFFAILALVFTAFTFTACSDDDFDAEHDLIGTWDVYKEIDGHYSGGVAYEDAIFNFQSGQEWYEFYGNGESYHFTNYGDVQYSYTYRVRDMILYLIGQSSGAVNEEWFLEFSGYNNARLWIDYPDGTFIELYLRRYR